MEIKGNEQKYNLNRQLLCRTKTATNIKFANS